MLLVCTATTQNVGNLITSALDPLLVLQQHFTYFTQKLTKNTKTIENRHTYLFHCSACNTCDLIIDDATIIRTTWNDMNSTQFTKSLEFIFSLSLGRKKIPKCFKTLFWRQKERKKGKKKYHCPFSDSNPRSSKRRKKRRPRPLGHADFILNRHVQPQVICLEKNCISQGTHHWISRLTFLRSYEAID